MPNNGKLHKTLSGRTFPHFHISALWSLLCQLPIGFTVTNVSMQKANTLNGKIKRTRRVLQDQERERDQGVTAKLPNLGFWLQLFARYDRPLDGP